MARYLVTHEAIRFSTHNPQDALAHGCLFRPQLPNPQGGILILHDRWGVNRHILGMSERYAHVGYVTLVVDLYRGKAAAEATNLAERLPAEFIDSCLRTALRWLRAQSFVKPEAVGCVSFGWGNHHALRLATGTDRPQALVTFYGHGDKSDETGAGQTAWLGVYGEADETATALKQLRETLPNAQRPWELISYPQAGYGFFDEFSAAFRFDDAEDAWSRSNKFFYRHLGEPM